jgi:DNA-binding XRE family transcriptional regulator
LELLQRDVADRIGVTQFTILNWEKGRTTPSISAFPGIIRFLGYDPFPKPGTIE